MMSKNWRKSRYQNLFRLEITENLKMDYSQEPKLSLTSVGATTFVKKKTVGFQYFTE